MVSSGREAGRTLPRLAKLCLHADHGSTTSLSRRGGAVWLHHDWTPRCVRASLAQRPLPRYEEVAFQVAVWLHAEVVGIHPFGDGNGPRAHHGRRGTRPASARGRGFGEKSARGPESAAPIRTTPGPDRGHVARGGEPELGETPDDRTHWTLVRHDHHEGHLIDRRAEELPRSAQGARRALAITSVGSGRGRSRAWRGGGGARSGS